MSQLKSSLGPVLAVFILAVVYSYGDKNAQDRKAGSSEVTILKKKKQPNIVLLFTDDAGYGDFGFQGSTIFKTPELDKFASEGMLFKEAYVSGAVCGPSRAGLLTGRYQQRFGFEENNVPGYMSASGLDNEAMGLPTHIPTVANYLDSLGYQNALLGKWHMGGEDKFHPLRRGFHYFYGFRGGARSYFPYSEEELKDLYSEKRLEENFGGFKEHEGYLTEVLADKSLEFIEKNKNNPFFLMVSFNGVHTPMEAKKEDLDQFPDLKGKRKTLAAMTLAVDRACGRIFDQLKQLGLDDHTIVIYTNDNGGPTDSNASSNYPLSGTKANHLEGGIRVPFIVRWPEVAKPNTTYPYPVSTLDLLPTFVSAAGGDVDEMRELDGVDLKPFISGELKERPHEYLYWKKENRGVVRANDWKLLRFPDRPAELYNIAEDISEQNNLASQHPEKVKELYKKLFSWEAGLERPLWQLKRLYEVKAMERMDEYRTSVKDPKE
ncbi:sulfatase-like hydrolase/transferase [Cytophaga sp. FL35]|uniref:sulfatase-like hydrolase/transferase n=1 Tax=Cytophaga sp. FL35 TaxID=1904456 RepID=UPI0025707C55|nr:sulfatase-like hydrolase/transferase [Cytophaga sp. FL35]